MGVQQERAVVDLVINGRQSEASLKDITKASINARKALASMAETDPGYKKQEAELKSLMRAQQQRIVKIHEEKTAWQRFKDQGAGMLTGIVGGNLVTTGIQKLLELGPMVIDHQLKLRDSFADIAKEADMTDGEVNDLNKSLKNLDTRTATEELRNMAVVGGQFGVAKKDMAGFVESADMLNVDLGDQFESVEKVAETSLTLRNIFSDIKSDNIADDMLKIGNGLNYLEAQGAATAPTMADFSSRIGGVAIPLGLTSGQVLGLSASLQELDITAERGSTAVNTILSGITNAPESFAKYARGVDGATMSSKKFKDLVNTDLNAALLAVIRGFNTGDTSATGLSAKLADLDLKGDGVKEVFLKLATNTQLVTDRQAQAATALSNTSSITAEFSKKNHDLAVNLKKLGEWFESFLENGYLTRFAEGVVSLTVKFLGLNKEVNAATKSFLEQKAKVSDLEKNIAPLIKRYDELAKNGKRGREEQAEMKKITDQIATSLPAAVTQFDNYGNAIGISTDRVREMIKAQKEMQAQLKASALDEQQMRLGGIDKERKDILRQLKDREQVELLQNGKVRVTPLSPEDLAQRRAQLQKLQSEEYAILRQMRELEGGQSIADRRKGRREAEKPPVKPNADLGTQETEEERKAREKKEKADKRAQDKKDRQDKKDTSDIQRKEDEYARLMTDARQRTAKLEHDEFQKEQLAFGEHYAKLFELAGTNADKMEEVTRQMYVELAAITANNDERERLKKAKDYRETLDLAEDALIRRRKAEEEAIKQAQSDKKISDEEARAADLKSEQTFLLAKKLLYDQYYKDINALGITTAEKKKELANEQAAYEAAIERQLTTNVEQQIDARMAYADKADKAMYERQVSYQQAVKGILQETLELMQINWTEQLEGLKSFWQKATVLQKAAFVASKAYAVAEATVAYARTLMNIWASSGSPWAAVGFTALATATYGTVLGKIAQANYNVPQFATGGFTGTDDTVHQGQMGPSGFVEFPTLFQMGRRKYVAGEKGREWIMSAPMLRNPVMANLAGALQALQVSGGYRNLRLDSGGASAGVGNGSGQGSDPALLAILGELQQNRATMEAYANRPIQNKLNYFDLERTSNQVKTIRDLRKG